MKRRNLKQIMNLKSALAIVLVAASLPVFGSDTRESKRLAPIFPRMGNLHHPITTSSERAQRYFDQGLTFCYAFNHKEAIRSFRAAATLDPSCTMAFWGIAYACGPHVNKPMSKEEVVQAWSALQQALALRKRVSPKEQAYLQALARRYQPEYTEDRSALDKAYAAAMREVVQQYPDDLDAWTLFAEALMDTMPWDYWAKDRSPKPETIEATEALRHVIARYPEHPGANHLYIHAVEAGPTPELALPSANRLLNYAPQAGHLVHMPSHIYLRVGQYHDATLANEMAIKADQSYIQHCRAQGFYPGAYYPHNVHFLWFATMLEGRSGPALAAARKVADYALDVRCATPVPEAPRFRHLPWLTLARFGRWNEVLNVEKPVSTNDFAIDRIMWHYTRGFALATLGRTDAAALENTEMLKLIHSDPVRSLENPQFPATAILSVAEYLLGGKVAAARGDLPTAIEHYEKAVTAEDAIPYMEPPYWPFAARPTLGAAWLKAGNAVKAEQTFRDDLRRIPRNGWALFGLERSLRRQGKDQAADSVLREFEQAWRYADVGLDLAAF